jgi:hypothetical protein
MYFECCREQIIVVVIIIIIIIITQSKGRIFTVRVFAHTHGTIPGGT